MRARHNDKKNLIKVGIFTALLTLVIMIMVASIGKETALFEPKVEIKARVPNVSNLKTGSYVELKGIRIGAVTGIEIVSEEEVELEMTILENQLKWIKEDSKAAISTAGLVGDKYVEIFTGSRQADQFDPNEDVLISDSVSGFNKIVTKGESIAEITERILTKLDNALDQTNNGKELAETINALNKTSKNLEKITSELRDAQMAQMVKNISASTASLNRVLNRIEKGPGTVNALIYDEGIHDDLRALLGGAQRNKVIKYFIRESIKKSEERKPRKD